MSETTEKTATITILEDGGVTAPAGFLASGVHCGVRRNRDKKDLALIVSKTRASAAAVYTKNLVKGAPILVTRDHLADGFASAAICNSGNANTCADGGVELAEEMCRLVSEATGVDATDVIVASTGVIGEKLSIDPFLGGIPAAAEALSASGKDAAQAIMTTDTKPKSAAVCVEIAGVTVTIGGIAKGSGMIAPNMATMLSFLTSDASISPSLAHEMLLVAVEDTFNMVVVDGDTSTNDMLCLMANGMSGAPEILSGTPEASAFQAALTRLCLILARMVASDGEGATKFFEAKVSGAASLADARKHARAVAASSLVKTAMFGSDANWGRILCALGYSGADLDPDLVDVSFVSQAGEVQVCARGRGVPFDEGLAKRILSESSVEVRMALGMGEFSATAFGCDLSYEYVKINGDYRT